VDPYIGGSACMWMASMVWCSCAEITPWDSLRSIAAATESHTSVTASAAVFVAVAVTFPIAFAVAFTVPDAVVGLAALSLWALELAPLYTVSTVGDEDETVIATGANATAAPKVSPPPPPPAGIGVLSPSL
jgi:hypothetical protein